MIKLSKNRKEMNDLEREISSIYYGLDIDLPKLATGVLDANILDLYFL